MLIWKQIPWFCDEEYEALADCLGPEDVKEAATALEAVVKVAASEAPKNIGKASFMMLEELRSMRHEIQVRIRTGTESTLTCQSVFSPGSLLDSLVLRLRLVPCLGYCLLLRQGVPTPGRGLFGRQRVQQRRLRKRVVTVRLSQLRIRMELRIQWMMGRRE